jgi:hypothetical protein
VARKYAFNLPEIRFYLKSTQNIFSLFPSLVPSLERWWNLPARVGQGGEDSGLAGVQRMRPEEKASEACRRSSPPRAPELGEGRREWKQERGTQVCSFLFSNPRPNETSPPSSSSRRPKSNTQHHRAELTCRSPWSTHLGLHGARQS